MSLQNRVNPFGELCSALAPERNGLTSESETRLAADKTEHEEALREMCSGATLVETSQQMSTILPAEPGSRISLCARDASASGNSLPTTGRRVPFSRPAKIPAWISASSVTVIPHSVDPRIEARRPISSRGLMVALLR